MAEKTVRSRGACSFCGREMTRAGMAKHLQTCSVRAEQIAKAEAAAKGPRAHFYQLQIEDAFSPDYWLHLEMTDTATLKKLDDYLREIWLECCGHLSHFSAGDPWSGPRIGKTRTAGQAFRPGVELLHIYDYGTPSETLVKVVAMREGHVTSRRPIALLSRNEQPLDPCMVCGQQAAKMCMECVIEEEKSGLLCETHAEGHPHKNYGEPLNVVNSPRMGLCGYEGPANPPY